MGYTCASTGKRVECTRLLGKGGEGQVFATSADRLVAKIYWDAKLANPDLVPKLRYMIANPPVQPPSPDNHIAITWPRDLVEEKGRVVGFLLDAASGEQLHEAVTPANRKQKFPGQTWHHSVATAHNLSWIVANIHAKGYVIGDFSEENVLVQEGGVVSLIDTDSFQITDSLHNKTYPCLVQKPDFSAPELTTAMMQNGQRRSSQDCFALAIIVCRLLLCGNHPFSGVYQLPGDPPAPHDFIRRGLTFFARNGDVRPRPAAPSPDILPPDLRALFEQTFITGHSDPGLRPGASDWRLALKTVSDNVATCSRNVLHVYSNHLSECPWCELLARCKVDYYDPNALPPRDHLNRPTVYKSPSAMPPSVSVSTQIHVPVQSVSMPLRLPAPRSRPTPALSAAAPPQAAPVPSAAAAAGPRPRRARRNIGFAARLVVGAAVAALFVWLNVTPSLWPNQNWQHFDARMSALSYHIDTQVQTYWTRYAIPAVGRRPEPWTEYVWPQRFIAARVRPGMPRSFLFHSPTARPIVPGVRPPYPAVVDSDLDRDIEFIVPRANSPTQSREYAEMTGFESRNGAGQGRR